MLALTCHVSRPTSRTRRAHGPRPAGPRQLVLRQPDVERVVRARPRGPRRSGPRRRPRQARRGLVGDLHQPDDGAAHGADPRRAARRRGGVLAHRIAAGRNHRVAGRGELQYHRQARAPHRRRAGERVDDMAIGRADGRRTGAPQRNAADRSRHTARLRAPPARLRIRRAARSADPAAARRHVCCPRGRGLAAHDRDPARLLARLDDRDQTHAARRRPPPRVPAADARRPRADRSDQRRARPRRHRWRLDAATSEGFAAAHLHGETDCRPRQPRALHPRAPTPTAASRSCTPRAASSPRSSR